MRILYLTNGFPYPLTSGYLRHYFFIRGLSLAHRVTLLSLVGRRFEPDDVAGLAPFVERVEVFGAVGGRRRSVLSRAGRKLAALSTADRPTGAVRDMRSWAVRLHAAAPFDLVFVSGKGTYPVIDALPDIPLVADLCDATSMRLSSAVAYAPLARRPLLMLEARAVRRVERRLVQRARHVIFASLRDLRRILGERTAAAGEPNGRGHGRTPRATVVPNGVDLDFWRRSTDVLGQDRIVFTGAMDYPPNADAAIHLARQVLPLVRREVPGTQLTIAGRDPGLAVQAMGRRAGVSVTGFLDDLRPTLTAAAVFAAPLRFGAGIQNKVLEAMAMEVPVVASSLAAEGLVTGDGVQPPILTADGPEATAARLVERLRAARSEPAPDAEARRYVADRFDWDDGIARLEEIFTRVVHEQMAR